MFDYHLYHQNYHRMVLVLTNQVIVLLNQLVIKEKQNRRNYMKYSIIQSCKLAGLNFRHKSSYCFDTRNDA